MVLLLFARPTSDRVDALLKDVHDAGPSGVVRVIGASLIVKIVKTGRCRLRHMLEAVAGILVEHRTGSADKAMALACVGEEADDIGKEQRPREAWPSIEYGSVKENDGGGWQLFFRILEKLGEEGGGEKFSRPSCSARIARSLPLYPQEPACHVELPAFQSKRRH